MRISVTGFLALVAFGIIGCTESHPTGTEPDAGMWVRGANGGPGSSLGDPIVRSVKPDTAVQGATLEVEVSGDNFEPGSSVDWALGGVATADITTSQTIFVSKRKLIATIHVASDAATTFFDAVVTTPPGRRGIGSELLEVKTLPLRPIDTSAELMSGSIDYSNQGAGVRSAGAWGDGAGTYPSILDFNQSDPNGWLRLGSGRSRSLCFDFSDASAIRLVAGERLSWPLEVVCFEDTDFHTAERRDGPIGPAFERLAVGQTDVQGGKFVVRVGRGRTAERWRILFDPVGNQDPPDLPASCNGLLDDSGAPILSGNERPRGNALRIERLADTADGRRRWTIEPLVDGDGNIGSAELLVERKDGLTCVGKIESMPFRILVTEAA